MLHCYLKSNPKKVNENKGGDDKNCNWYPWNGLQRFGKGLEELVIIIIIIIIIMLHCYLKSNPKKVNENKGGDDKNCNWYPWNGLQRFGKGLEELVIGGRAKTIQTTSLLRSARIMRRI